jgi:hypothetical protein
MTKRIKITTWLDAETADGVRDLAAVHRLTVSETAAELLRHAVRDRAASTGGNLLLAEVRQAVRNEVRAIGNRLAHLLARTALESIAGRRELFNLVSRQLDTKSAQVIREGSWKAAVDSLRRPLGELRDVLTSIDGDMASRDTPEPSR